MRKTIRTAGKNHSAPPTLSIERRRFTQWVAASLILGSCRLGASTGFGGKHAGSTRPTKLKVAAIQMVPKLGNVDANLTQAENLVREAIGRGAEWIVLPEMFTSAAAFHEDMIRAIRPLNGSAAQLLKNMAKEGRVVVGCSFLGRDGTQV